MSTHIPYSVNELYDMTMERYQKDEMRYVDIWYDKVIEQVKKGSFNATLEVNESDCTDGTPNDYVMTALGKIKEIFKGLHSDIYDDGVCPYYMVFWDLHTVKKVSKKDVITY